MPSWSADIVQRADMRMVQRGDSASLAFEPFAREGIGGEMWRQHLDRDGAIKARIERLVDFAHPASADARTNLIRTDGSSFEDTGSGRRTHFVDEVLGALPGTAVGAHRGFRPPS